MVWNYRGYGRSNGQPSPTNLRHDAEIVLKYLRESMGIRGKVGVYGRSLGGIPTTHLAD
jgi:pimeloyl-ACP methyl ester carboxylesterase